MKRIILLCALLMPMLGVAQNFSIDWYEVAGGGGTSTNSPYSLSGTIGQQDASGALSGGNYSVTGGYWSLINVVQMPDGPNLFIVPNGPGSVKIFWPNTGSYTLQQNSNLVLSEGWKTSGYAVTTNSPAGTNSIIITPPTGDLFFRLSNP